LKRKRKALLRTQEVYTGEPQLTRKTQTKPSKQSPRQNLENKEPTKRLPAKETKQHPKNQENLRTTHKKAPKQPTLRPIGLVSPTTRRSFDVSVIYGTF
jgi:hypothetical protein